ncbi:MAG: hypothetical protein PVF06_13440, partial [Gammaproteobacteria bacterium]
MHGAGDRGAPFRWPVTGSVFLCARVGGQPGRALRDSPETASKSARASGLSASRSVSPVRAWQSPFRRAMSARAACLRRVPLPV